jgi:hypothetical protein
MSDTLITVVVAVFLLFPCQPALDDQCQDYTYAKLHPTICGDTGNGFGVGGSGSSGGSSGGLLGGIGKILHGLTGGLL